MSERLVIEKVLRPLQAARAVGRTTQTLRNWDAALLVCGALYFDELTGARRYREKPLMIWAGEHANRQAARARTCAWCHR